MKKVEFKKDQYRKARGGYSRFLNVSCSECGNFLLLYQKDGPGILKRMYMDRIFEPEKLANFQLMEISEAPNLVCGKCGLLIGTPYIYEKENRKAFLLRQGSFSKKITKKK